MQSLTANRLDDGAVVYRTKLETWSRNDHDAAVFENDASAALEEAGSDVIRALVVGVELIDVTMTDTGTTPVSLREKIRAFGPTI